MRGTRRAITGFVPLLLVGCGMLDEQENSVRLGGSIGWTLTDVSEDLDNPDGSRAHEPDTDVSGFVELGLEGRDESMLITRLLYADTAHEVDGFLRDIRLRQWLGFGLWAPTIFNRGDFEVRPLVGLGGGFVDFDYPASGTEFDTDGVAVAFALGIEAEVLDNFTFGLFGYGGGWGSLGETDGTMTQAMAYFGVRF